MQQQFREFMAHLTPRLNRHLALAAVGIWVPVALFAAIANEVRERGPLPFDIPILTTVHQLATPARDDLVAAFTNLGGPLVIVVTTLGLFGVLLYLNRPRRALTVLLISGGSALINLLLKATFQRTRPSLWESIVTEKSFSFPSGHAMASSALAFSIMAMCWHTRWRWLSVGLGTAYILIIGFTRLYLGVHYPSDVVAGWCVSLAWALLVYWVLKKHQSHPRPS